MKIDKEHPDLSTEEEVAKKVLKENASSFKRQNQKITSNLSLWTNKKTMNF